MLVSGVIMSAQGPDVMKAGRRPGAFEEHPAVRWQASYCSCPSWSCLDTKHDGICARDGWHSPHFENEWLCRGIASLVLVDTKGTKHGSHDQSVGRLIEKFGARYLSIFNAVWSCWSLSDLVSFRIPQVCEPTSSTGTFSVVHEASARAPRQRIRFL